ncbi:MULTISPECIES: flagellar basal body rod protein FlgC [Limnochorda]|uniref:flagellar basal body rod protein FlgC n=1 Tax=Limnochorda TaxID=1676651 RepID=UPI001D2A92AD|nr:flagellar basal body rod protein FlgC [Limnochorda pilosa]MBO2486992.1 flagellar basal body rod protein FlgC [Bacillota bacterium]MBO2518178.1 flagellar basal body rod protein FlgC [Bacillota bacterium]
MSLFGAMDVSASGLTAERLRMDLIASNLANANTTRTPEGGPYRRLMAVLVPEAVRSAGHPMKRVGGGVRVQAIIQDPNPPRLVYQPDHPDADAEGYVAYPNVNPVTEMVDLITATRAYEANVTAFNAAKGMATKALEIGRA